MRSFKKKKKKKFSQVSFCWPFMCDPRPNWHQIRCLLFTVWVLTVIFLLLWLNRGVTCSPDSHLPVPHGVWRITDVSAWEVFSLLFRTSLKITQLLGSFPRRIYISACTADCFTCPLPHHIVKRYSTRSKSPHS